MGELVERAAAALWDHQRLRLGFQTVAFTGLYEFRKNEIRDEVRAVFQAARAPSAEMDDVDTASISWMNAEIWPRFIDAILADEIAPAPMPSTICPHGVRDPRACHKCNPGDGARSL